MRNIKHGLYNKRLIALGQKLKQFTTKQKHLFETTKMQKQEIDNKQLTGAAL